MNRSRLILDHHWTHPPNHLNPNSWPIMMPSWIELETELRLTSGWWKLQWLFIYAQGLSYPNQSQDGISNQHPPHPKSKCQEPPGPLHLKAQSKKLKFRTWVFQRPMTKYFSWWRIPTQIWNLQHPLQSRINLQDAKIISTYKFKVKARNP